MRRDQFAVNPAGEREVASEVLSNPDFTNRIEELGNEFYDPVAPARFPKETLRYWNDPLVEKTGATHFFAQESVRAQHFARFQPLPGSLSQPLALRYHGHQFRHYNPDLGDGRGFLFAQLNWQNKLWDFGTKGSGQTPYSRAGDGKLTLKGAYREALATELLESLGVRTSRTFCFFETHEQLERGDEPSPTRSAVLTRFSHSHVRLGTFQRLLFFRKKEEMEKLVRYCARHLTTELNADESIEILVPNFLRNVSHRLAHLSAQWMIAGFVHGVLNTDNLNITGESFDYGPYRFLPNYDPSFTAAYFDQQGLYCFGRQPTSVLWALERFAETLQLIAPAMKTEEILSEFGDVFQESIALMFCHRLNIKPQGFEKDSELIQLFYTLLDKHDIGYEQAYFDFFRTKDSCRFEKSPQAMKYQGLEAKNFLKEFEKYEIESSERAENSYYQNEKPVTLLIEEIEQIWKKIADLDDWSGFEAKLIQIRKIRGLYDLKSKFPDHFGATMGSV